MKKYPTYHAYVDGGCVGNGRINAKAYGSYRVYGVEGYEPEPGEIDELSIVLEQKRFKLLKYGTTLRSKIRPTNNIAEALSMQMLITTLWATKIMQPDVKIRIFSDSKLVLNQLLGLYKVKNKNLLEAHQGTYAVIKKFEEKYQQSIFSVLSLEFITGAEMKLVLGH